VLLQRLTLSTKDYNSDITAIVNFSMDRASKLLLVAETWNAPMSVVIYLTNNLKSGETEIEQIQKWCSSIPVYKKYLDIHVVHAAEVS
jgi:hypothetical protein